MPNGTDRRGDRAPRPSRLMAEPATPEACAADLRPNDPTAPNGQQAAAGAARNQLALSRAAARR
ncbi:hypothetical protein ACFVY4_27110 [Streptomyces sp. NPDC058299]|uniref:hypothetical protein n=1 Tax=Streptomyces sp. NPDC058299 TaxID=3346435 RepID=UPI0036E1A972